MTKSVSVLASLFLLALTVSGCKSVGAGHYVGRNEFDRLSNRVDKLEQNSGQAGAAQPKSASPGGQGGIPVMVQAGVGGQTAMTPPPPNSGLLPPAGGGAAKSSPAAAPAAGKSEKAAYQRGQVLLKQKKYEQAAEVFRGMLNQYPSGSLAPNARYWLGECYYARGEYSQAAAEFLRCAGDYPASPKAPDALLKLSYSYDRLGDGPQAMSALDQLLSRYPESEAANMMKSGRGGFKG